MRDFLLSIMILGAGSLLHLTVINIRSLEIAEIIESFILILTVSYIVYMELR